MDFYTGRALGLSKRRQYRLANPGDLPDKPRYSFTYLSNDKWPFLYKCIGDEWHGYIPNTRESIQADTLGTLKLLACSLLDKYKREHI